MTIEYDRPAASYNFLCHGRNTKKLCTVPPNMEIIIFSWQREALSVEKTYLLFEWLRTNYTEGDILTSRWLNIGREQSFRLGYGYETAIARFGPNNTECPDLDFSFVNDSEVNPAHKPAVLGVYDTSVAQLQYNEPMDYPTPIRGKNISRTAYLYTTFGLQVFSLRELLDSNVFMQVPDKDGIIRVYIITCRSGYDYPSRVMNVEYNPATKNIPGKPPVVENTRSMDGGERKRKVKTRRKRNAKAKVKAKAKKRSKSRR